MEVPGMCPINMPLTAAASWVVQYDGMRRLPWGGRMEAGNWSLRFSYDEVNALCL